MKLSRIVPALALVSALAGVAYVAQVVEPAGPRMTRAADKFLASLTEEQKQKARHAFDDKERSNWHFIPMQDKNRRATRKGLPLEEMTAAQKEAALALVKAGTSLSGYDQAGTIMSLEAILRDVDKGGMVRNPAWYFLTIFGAPGQTEKWGWRVEGHHLSLNFTVDKGKVMAATPFFFGASPAQIKDGPRKGLRTLADAEDLAKALFQSLGDEQKKIALVKDQFPEIEQAKPAPNVGAPQGLPAAQMTDAQKTALLKLLQAYTARMPADVGEVELKQVHDAGMDKVHFAYAGSLEDGQPHSYRVQGPTFVVEFLNVQMDASRNSANHVHSVWRNTRGDFGLAR